MGGLGSTDTPAWGPLAGARLAGACWGAEAARGASTADGAVATEACSGASGLAPKYCQVDQMERHKKTVRKMRCCSFMVLIQ
jgi:hypothetical protein